MFPIKNFSDLFGFINDENRVAKSPFYIMALYQSDHIVFREFILSQFTKIHHQTQDIAFIVCDTPPEGWVQREDAQYYEKLVGKDFRPLLIDYEIDIIAKYMDVPIEALPCLVFFSDLTKHNFNCFSFADENIIKKEEFFSSLLEKTALFSSSNKSYLDVVIELGKEFRELREFPDWDKDNVIKQRLSNARDDIGYYRAPERAQTKKKPRKLTSLQITRQCCQARAQQIWAKNQDISISEMKNDRRLLDCFEEYDAPPVQPKTIHYWINRYAPPHQRKPGQKPQRK